MNFKENISKFLVQICYLTLISLTIFFIQSCEKHENSILPPPNIILLVSEDNSPFLGSYGDTVANTPNLDAFAKNGVKFSNAFANAPVCAPSRSTIISGMYATSMGTQHMRSENAAPEFMKFFPYYLKKAGYYTTNRVKKDYNTADQDSVWDVSDWWAWKDALKDKKSEQPFFLMYNTWMSHESKIHPDDKVYKYFSDTMEAHDVDSTQTKLWWNEAKFDMNKIKLPKYHPNTPEMKADWAKYYECMELMDREMGVVLNKIKADGYWDNSIIIYMSDHGGVLARSKRFIYDSGLRVPLIMHVPEKYKSYVSQKMGSESDQVISLIDLAPTILSLAGVETPSYLEGKSFHKDPTKNEYAFGFRGRMDERYDMVRTVRDKKFRYIRNYMPHRIAGGKIKYLWKAKSVASWESYYKDGKCNPAQAAFWETRPTEELYEIATDGNNTTNLALDPNYVDDLKRLRTVLQNHVLKTKDLGFIPEVEMIRRSANTTPHQFIRSNGFPFDKVVETATFATESNAENLNLLIERLSDSEPVVRYWAATGCAILKTKAIPAKAALLKLLEDKSPSVRIASAEALFYLHEQNKSIATLTQVLELPKLEKNDPVTNTTLYANHFAITHALNVIDALNIKTKNIRKLTTEIANAERANKKDYDKRSAEDLLSKLN